MANPYEAPISEVARPGAYRAFRFEDCFAQAWKAFTPALWLLVVSSLVLGVMFTAGALLLVVGWIFLLPALLWGGAHFYLKVFDREPTELGDLFVGFQGDYWLKTGQMGMLMVVNAVLGIASSAVYYIGFFTDDELLMVVGFLIQMVVQYLVITRLVLAPFFIVDGGMTTMQALAASWQSTSRQWLLFIAVAFLSYMIQGMGAILCLVGLLASVPYGYLMFVSVYRQVTGTSKDVEALPEVADDDDELAPADG